MGVIDRLNTESMQIIVATDDPLLRQQVRSVVLRGNPDWVVVDAKDSFSLAEQVRQTPDAQLLILDTGLPLFDTPDDIAAVRQRIGTTPLVVLTDCKPPYQGDVMMAAGATGCLCKPIADKHLSMAIERALIGELFLSDEAITVNDPFCQGSLEGMAVSTFFCRLLDQIPLGVLLVDEAAKVVFMNRNALRVVESRDGLEVASTQMCRALLVQENTALRALIKTTIDSGTQGAMSISRPHSDRQAISLMVLPLPKQESTISQNLAMIFVTDPEQTPTPSVHLLVQLYNLTEAEARVVQALVGGASPEQVSELLAISTHTVRSHLKRVFRKTGTTRQAELVKLVMSNPWS